MATQNLYERIVPFMIFTGALVLLFMLISPMITTLLSSILLAYISFPLYKRIAKKIPHKSTSIILSLFIIATIILIPFSFLAVVIAQQGYYFYNSFSSKIIKGELFGYGCISKDSEVCSLVNQVEKFSLAHLSKFGLDKQLQKFLPILKEKMANLILSMPIIIAQIFLTIVISYYLLKDWENLLRKMADILPVRAKTIRRLIKEFGNIASTVIYAQLFVAFAQGIVGTIGLYLFGVPFPVFLGVLMAFCALIPNVGTALIWIPASLYLMLGGYFSNNSWVLGKGIGLFLYGVFIINIIDNILLVKIVQAKAKVSQITVIVGVIGGAGMFGVVGIFIGPILLPLLITYFETFKQRFA